MYFYRDVRSKHSLFLMRRKCPLDCMIRSIACFLLYVVAYWKQHYLYVEEKAISFMRAEGSHQTHHLNCGTARHMTKIKIAITMSLRIKIETCKQKATAIIRYWKNNCQWNTKRKWWLTFEEIHWKLDKSFNNNYNYN